MKELQQLTDLCACEVGVTVNENRSHYETVEEFLDDLAGRECPPQIDAETRARMVKENTVAEVWFYPDTPIGSYSLYDSDVSRAVARALDIARKLRGQVPKATEIL